VRELKVTFSQEETIACGERLARTLSSGSVITLHGDLGAGKTTFMKGIAQGCGISPLEVHSPTFNYLNIYTGTKVLYHFDLYRLKDQNDFISLGFADFFEEEGLVCLEWPEKITDILPKLRIEVHLFHQGEEQRLIEIKKL